MFGPKILTRLLYPPPPRRPSSRLGRKNTAYSANRPRPNRTEQQDASNKFGESVVHIACRRGNLDVLRFLVANGGSLTACDDLGRFPLHEVCWAAQPRFDIVRVFLEEERRTNARRRRRHRRQAGGGGGGSDDGGVDAEAGAEADADADADSDADGGELTMLLLADKRGCSPLRYVKPESWPLWHRFLDEVADEYWPSMLPSPAQQK